MNSIITTTTINNTIVNTMSSTELLISSSTVFLQTTRKKLSNIFYQRPSNRSSHHNQSNGNTTNNDNNNSNINSNNNGDDATKENNKTSTNVATSLPEMYEKNTTPADPIASYNSEMRSTPTDGFTNNDRTSVRHQPPELLKDQNVKHSINDTKEINLNSSPLKGECTTAPTNPSESTGRRCHTISFEAGAILDTLSTMYHKEFQECYRKINTKNYFNELAKHSTRSSSSLSRSSSSSSLSLSSSSSCSSPPSPTNNSNPSKCTNAICRKQMIQWFHQLLQYLQYPNIYDIVETATILVDQIMRIPLIKQQRQQQQQPLHQQKAGGGGRRPYGISYAAFYDRQIYQLVCITVLYLTIKATSSSVSEIISMETMITLSRNTISKQQLQQMELLLLDTLFQWKINPPTSISFVHYYLLLLEVLLQQQQNDQQMEQEQQQLQVNGHNFYTVATTSDNNDDDQIASIKETLFEMSQQQCYHALLEYDEYYKIASSVIAYCSVVNAIEVYYRSDMIKQQVTLGLFCTFHQPLPGYYTNSDLQSIREKLFVALVSNDTSSLSSSASRVVRKSSSSSTSRCSSTTSSTDSTVDTMHDVDSFGDKTTKNNISTCNDGSNTNNAVVLSQASSADITENYIENDYWDGEYRRSIRRRKDNDFATSSSVRVLQSLNYSTTARSYDDISRCNNSALDRENITTIDDCSWNRTDHKKKFFTNYTSANPIINNTDNSPTDPNDFTSPRTTVVIIPPNSAVSS